MQKHWKKIVIGIVALAVIVVAGSFIYAKVINDSPDKLSTTDLDDALGTTSPDSTVVVDGTPDATTDEGTIPSATTADTVATDGTDAGGTDDGSVDGTWNVTTASELRYRVKESINGFDTEGVGSTNQITGSLTIAGTQATAADFTVDMTTFTSDESRRDGQFNGRVMTVDEFPTATFVLTAPIEFGSVPASGEQITTTANGDLTLRGVTKNVTFELTAQQENGKVGVLGNIPVLFSDYGIENPSFGTISTEDNGLLEFILVFEQA